MDDIEKYKEDYDEGKYSMQPRLRSLISRGSKVVKREIQDPETGKWRTVIRMSRDKFDEEAKGVFLQEYAKWGRMGEAAAAAGVTPGTVRRHMEEDEDFAEAFYVQEEEYREKLIGHHQNLVFNGVEKNRYDKDGNLIETSYDYPIRLIELELKKHDKGYRDKQEVAINHSGGVLVAPAETQDIDDWEKRFGAAKDITPSPLGITDEEEDQI